MFFYKLEYIYENIVHKRNKMVNIFPFFEHRPRPLSFISFPESSFRGCCSGVIRTQETTLPPSWDTKTRVRISFCWRCVRHVNVSCVCACVARGNQALGSVALGSAVLFSKNNIAGAFLLRATFRPVNTVGNLALRTNVSGPKI